MRHGPRLCHGLASARRARSAVREPNYGPEGEIEWELRPWIAGLTEFSARTPPVLSDTTQDSLVPPLSSPTQRHSINGMARGAYEISPDMAPGADEPSLPALPKVSPDRWRQEYTGCSTVLAITLTDLVLVLHDRAQRDGDAGRVRRRGHDSMIPRGGEEDGLARSDRQHIHRLPCSVLIKRMRIGPAVAASYGVHSRPRDPPLRQIGIQLAVGGQCRDLSE